MTPSVVCSHFLHNNDSLMKQLGRDLRIISEDFAKSKERRRVLQKAEQVRQLVGGVVVNAHL